MRAPPRPPAPPPRRAELTIPVPVNGSSARSDDSERLWVWQYNDIEAYMELDDAVRFRVTGVRFPKPPKSAEEVRHLLPSEGGTPAGKFAPMVVMGTIQSEALGCVTWWNEGDAPEDDAPADAEG